MPYFLFLFIIIKRGKKKRSELKTAFHAPETVGGEFGKLISGIPREGGERRRRKKKEKRNM